MYISTKLPAIYPVRAPDVVTSVSDYRWCAMTIRAGLSEECREWLRQLCIRLVARSKPFIRVALSERAGAQFFV